MGKHHGSGGGSSPKQGSKVLFPGALPLASAGVGGYTDDEKAIASGEFQAYVESENIELYRTRGHPAFAERFIKTFKGKLCKRVENDEKNNKNEYTMDRLHR